MYLSPPKKSQQLLPASPPVWITPVTLLSDGGANGQILVSTLSYATNFSFLLITETTSSFIIIKD